MGRRYYCDYCDKTFIDDLEARKKHLQSSHHIKLRNYHYELNREPEIILREELLKTPCRTFMQEKSCPYLGNCKYTHYSAQELYELRKQVEYKNNLKIQKEQEAYNIPSVESWLEKYKQQTNKESNDVVPIFWSYPESMALRHDLPPSLKKFKPEHFTNDDFEEWGH